MAVARETSGDSAGSVNGFMRVPRALIRTSGYRELSLGARSLLMEIWSHYNGFNNGKILYSIRQAEEALRCSRSSAVRWFRELCDGGFIEATERGGFRFKAGAREGRPTSWRINCLPKGGQDARQ